MAKEIKFTEEEIKSLGDLSVNYQRVQSSFGQLRVQKILLAQQSDSLEEAEVQLEADYTNLQSEERKIVEQLNKKYGPGTLDPQTGVFTPVESSEEKVEES